MNRKLSISFHTPRLSTMFFASFLFSLFGCKADDDDGSLNGLDSNRVGETADNQVAAPAEESAKQAAESGDTQSKTNATASGKGSDTAGEKSSASGGQAEEAGMSGSDVADSEDADSSYVQSPVDSYTDAALPHYPDASTIANSTIEEEPNQIDAGKTDLPELPYPVGTVQIEIGSGDKRTIPVQLWYPAVESARSEAEQGHPTEEFEPVGTRRDRLAAMLANSPDGCTSKVMHAAHSPEVLSLRTPFSTVVISHCWACARFSTFTVAEYLASRGFVVAAPDHADTIYESSMMLSVQDIENLLQDRANDIMSVIDMLLDEQSPSLITGLRGKIDSERLGMFGHSIGSMTTGRVLRDDPRVKAGIMVAAPIENEPFFGITIPGTEVDKIKQPGLFLVAAEDTASFSTGLEANYKDYPNPAWLVSLKDASHYSFTDIAGIDDNSFYAAGCGTGSRQDNPLETFTYLENDLARTITKKYTAAFFEARLNGDSDAEAYLKTADPPDIVTIAYHP